MIIAERPTPVFAWLVVVKGPDRGSIGVVHNLHPDTTTIGRVAGNHIVLIDETCSGQHARIRVEAQEDKDPAFVLYDMGSRNGTFVGDKETLKDDDQMVRSRACYALAQIGDSAATKPLLKLLDDMEPGVRSAAAYAIGIIGDDEAIEPLLEAFKEADQNERWGYQSAVGSYGTLAFDAGVELMGSEKKGLRQSGISRLSQTHDTRAKEHLIKALDDTSQEVRMDAARAIGHAPGGDIFIPGTPRAFRGRSDWTAGCIAVKNNEIEVIYSMVEVGTPIWLYP